MVGVDHVGVVICGVVVVVEVVVIIISPHHPTHGVIEVFIHILLWLYAIVQEGVGVICVVVVVIIIIVVMRCGEEVLPVIGEVVMHGVGVEEGVIVVVLLLLVEVLYLLVGVFLAEPKAHLRCRGVFHCVVVVMVVVVVSGEWCGTRSKKGMQWGRI